MRKYKISEFSKLMGVTVDLVKHYQDTGIVSPEVNEANKYRYYTIRHGERIVASRKFREMGFGLQDSKALIYEKDTDGISEMLLQKRKENEQTIRLLQLKNESLAEMQQEYEVIQKKAGTFEIVEKEGYYYVAHVTGEMLNENPVVVGEISNWMEHLDFSYKSYYVPKGEDGGYTDRSIGFLMKERYFEALGFKSCEQYKYFKDTKRLLYYYRERYDKQIRFSLEGERVLALARELGYDVDPNAFLMQHIFDDHVDGVRYTNYLIHFFMN